MYRVTKLGKQYGDTWALKDVSFSLPDVGLIAIKGKSGSGKSTLLNLLSLLEKPTEGTIEFEGNELSRLSDKKRSDFLSSTTSFVFQHFNLIEDMSVLENVETPLLFRGENKKEIRIKAESLLKKYGVLSLKEKMVGVLSGGEKQRVALCRALITNPKVLFADEPTGALDKENEKIVMDDLKALSKKILVIMVSHNEKIIEKYADSVLELSDGRLISKPLSCKHQNMPMEVKARKRHKSFLGWILKHNYKKNILKNGLSIISGVMGFCSLLLSLGFYNGSNQKLAEEKASSLLYTSATICKRRVYEIEGSPLKLNRLIKPTIEEVETAFSEFDARFAADLSFFMPVSTAFDCNGFEEEPAEFHPIFDLSLKDRTTSFVTKGKAPSGDTLDYVLVNEEFEKKYGGDILGKIISVNNQIQITEDNATDTLTLNYSFRVLGVVHEFAFLNTPKAFYSYPALESFLCKKKLENISKARGRDVSIIDFVNDENADPDYCGYSYLAFFSESDMPRIEKLGSEYNGLTISSDALMINQSFSSLINAFTTCLIPFLIISIIGVAFILGSLSCSSFLERKKQAAILTSLGASKEDLSFIYEGEGLMNVLISSVISIAVSFPAQKLLSMFLESKVGLSNLVRIPFSSFLGISFFPIIMTVVFALVIAIFGSSIPLNVMARKPVVEELRDE